MTTKYILRLYLHNSICQISELITIFCQNINGTAKSTFYFDNSKKSSKSIIYFCPLRFAFCLLEYLVCAYKGDGNALFLDNMDYIHYAHYKAEHKNDYACHLS